MSLDITFQLTNHVTDTVESTEEIIGVGFINNSESFEIRNVRTLAYAALTAEEKAIADAFVNMMRVKVLEA